MCRKQFYVKLVGAIKRMDNKRDSKYRAIGI